MPLPEETILLLETLQLFPINAAQIKTWTNQDPVLSKVRDLVLQGWLDTSDSLLLPYQRRKYELSILNGCVLLGNRELLSPPRSAGMFKSHLW